MLIGTHNIVDGFAYFSISFRYHNHWYHNPDHRYESDEFANGASYACWMAAHFAERTLHTAGLDYRHAYGWPDGSCYKDFRLPVEELPPKPATLFFLTSRIQEALSKRARYRKVRQLGLYIENIKEYEFPGKIDYRLYSLHEFWTLGNGVHKLWEKRNKQRDEWLEKRIAELVNDPNIVSKQEARHQALDELRLIPVEL